MLNTEMERAAEPIAFPFAHQPFAHQRDEWEVSRDLVARAVFWEMGCGKSKLTIDTAIYLFLEGKIDAIMVLAPNSVHPNWISDEMPAHCPVVVPWRGVAYHSSRAKQKRQLVAMQRLSAVAANEPKPLRILSMSYSGIMTTPGALAAKAFMQRFRCLLVCDESTYIKAPKAKRTKRVLAMAKYAPYRRILTGTPVANSPFDLFSQMKFLDETFWKQHGMDDFSIFKSEIGVQRSFVNRGTGKAFIKTVAYRRLEWLHEILKPVSTRVTKKQALPHLPDKLYSKRRFEMSAKQQKAYDELTRTYRLELANGAELTAPLAMVRLLRLHQITSGYLPNPDEDSTERTYVEIDPGNNERLDALSEVVSEIPEGTQCIIWARFQRDIELICERLRHGNLPSGNRHSEEAIGSEGWHGPRTAVSYHGPTSLKDREEALRRFHAGEAQFFVANPACVGMGITLVEATTVIYYNNSFVLPDRLQSEDRAHRIGQKNAVTYIDLIAEDSVDDKIVTALRNKQDIASIITGDGLKEWI